MTEVSNNTKNLLQALGTNDDAYANADINDGSGSMGVWPPEGVYDLLVSTPTVEDSTVRDDQGQEHKAIQVQFGYSTTEPIPDHEDSMSFRGAPFYIPLNPANIPGNDKKGTKARIRIDMERLKGHLKTILRRDPGTSLQADLSEAIDILNSDESVICRTYLQYQQGKPDGDGNRRTYRKEFLQERKA